MTSYEFRSHIYDLLCKFLSKFKTRINLKFNLLNSKLINQIQQD